MTVHFVNLLDDLRRRSLRMAALVEDVLNEACDALLLGDENLARRVILRDEGVDAEEVEVEKEVIRLLALYQPVGTDLRLLCTILKVNNDFERIADCAVNVAERAKHLVDHPVYRADVEIREMCNVVQQTLRRAIQAYGAEDLEAAQAIRRGDTVIDDLYTRIIKDFTAEGATGPDNTAAMLDALSVAKNLERIADHATNIAEDVIYLITGQIVRHQS
ncbi:MAG: Phosphate-specific transport system accessory protein PhoU [Phycisphaerae bacterium]|nr:Phosphate-specific transport system accessory protein PhoU [Phycisphaerae bacterium]